MPLDRPPYPGLRSFKREETDLFFGRDDSVDAMIARLAEKRFLAVLGSSGVGKSSLVKTGLLSGLDMGLLEGAGARWWIVDFRPEDAPLRNLADRLLRTQPAAGKEATARTGEVTGADVNLLRARLNRSPRSLIEWCRLGYLPEGTNLLLLVDQFEELFRYGSDAGREEAEAFVSLLLESRHPTGFAQPQQAELPIYVAITMRSEYLGACSLIEGLAEAVNEGTYLVPRMTRDEFRAAITGPAQVCGIEIEEALVGRLLDDLASFAPWDDGGKPDQARAPDRSDQLSRLARRADQLPVMQHALNQMWREAVSRRAIGEERVALTLTEYEAIGKVKGALNRHANAILARLGPEREPVAEAVFRALVTGTTVASAVRRPTSFGELKQISGADDAAVREVVEAFRAPECNFLLPEVDHKRELDDETKVDLTHESLIRQWEKLSAWLEKEGRAAHDWQRLNEDAERSELLIGQRLANAVALRQDFNPNAAWASRYGIDFARVDTLLNDSVARAETERQEKDAALKREQERLHEVAAAQVRTARMQQRARWTLFALSAVLITGFGLGAWQQHQLGRAQTDLAAEQQRSKSRQADLDRAQADLSAAQVEITRRQAQLLEGFAAAERLRGNVGRALRLAVHAARLELGLGQSAASPSVAPALAAAVMQSAWLTVLSGHTDLVLAAHFSRDGTRVVTTSRDNTARVWDAASGKELAVMRGHESQVNSGFFSPDGSQVLTSGDNTARIWDTASGKELKVLRGHEGFVKFAAYSPDGTRVVTASQDKTARIWDVATAKETTVLRGHVDTVWTAAFSADGTRVVTGSDDRTARIWNAATGEQIAVLRGHTDWLGVAAFNPDGSRVLTSSGDGTVRVWDVKTAKEVLILRGHAGPVHYASFSPDGSRIASASGDDTVRIWDAATGRELGVLHGHESGVRCADFSPDGARIVTASDDRTARIWSATGGDILVLRGHENSVRAADFSPDGARIVTGSADKSVRVWDAVSGKELALLNGHSDWVNSAVFSRDGARILTASDDQTARIWDAKTYKQIRAFRGYEDSMRAAAFSADGARVVGASGKIARVWDVATGREVVVLRGHEDAVTSAAFSPDGSRVLTASRDKTARVWDVASGKEMMVLRGHTEEVFSAVYNRDGSQILTGARDKTAIVWDAATGKQLSAMRTPENSVFSAQFSPDGARVAAASADATVRIWDSLTANEIAVLRGHEGFVNFVAFSPDGSRLVTASSDRTARVWDVHAATEPIHDLLVETCGQRLRGLSRMSRDEMHIAGYPDSKPEIDVCDGVE